MQSSVVILQLSDLHFGDHSRFRAWNMEQLGRRCAAAVDQARERLGIKEHVHLLLATGDIGETAHPREYRDAQAFFDALMRGLGLAPRYVIFTPGNHDVSWARCSMIWSQAELEEWPERERDARLHRDKFDPFEAFVKAVGGADRENVIDARATRLGAHYAWVHDFAELGVSVAALNSCEEESHRTQIGHLSSKQAQALMDHWSAPDEMLRIVTVHHNPVAVPPDELKGWVQHLEALQSGGKLKSEIFKRFAADAVGFEGNEHLQRVAEERRVSVVLHGHHHHAVKGPAWAWRAGEQPGMTHVLSAGSWGLRQDKLPEEEPVMMHLLHLDTERATMRSIALRYEPRAVQPGEVEPGAFVVDDTGKNTPLLLSRPARSGTKKSMPAAEASYRETVRRRDFIDALRRHYAGLFLPLDLGGIGAVQRGGAGAPVRPRLDAVYVPVEFGASPESDVHFELDPDELLRRLPEGRVSRARLRGGRRDAADPRGLALIGPAGMGKTTWMRWTFRRLAERDDAVPFFIELRRLALLCDDHSVDAAKRNLRAFIDFFVEQLGVKGWDEALPGIFSATSGPTPVLLVDGWDELGDLGARTREQLNAFLSAHPRVRAVVSSRPYGDHRPGAVEGFEELHLHPLNDAQISALTEHFQRAVHGDDEATLERVVAEFSSALDASPDAKALAGTPLLLTMMLLISRDRPLPDKRHRLYDQCIDAMLSARPEQRRREGAQLTAEQWCPADSMERRRVVAALASSVQEQGYKESKRRAIVMARGEVESRLPEGWMRADRSRFVEWLIGAAGILTDRSDGSLSFTHLSFQEYLTAWHVAKNAEGQEARVAFSRAHLYSREWWETLRLWGAIVSDDNPNWFDAVAVEFVRDVVGIWLVGMMFADGSGTDGGAFEEWVRELPHRLHVEGYRDALRCAAAWRVSRQEDRRTRIVAGGRDAHQTWFGQVLAEGWCREAGIAASWARPFRIHLWDVSAPSGQALARGRLLVGCDPLWPRTGTTGLLRVWPSPRLAIARRLQGILCMSRGVGGIEESVRIQNARFERRHSPEVQNLASRVARDLAQDASPSFSPEVNRDVARDVARRFAQDFAKDFSRDVARYFARHFAKDFSRDIARYFAPDFESDLARQEARDVAEHFVWNVAQDAALGVAADVARHFARRAIGIEPGVGGSGVGGADGVDLAWIEIASLARVAATRAVLAVGGAQQSTEHHLVSLAARISYGNLDQLPVFEAALAAWSGDPLWPAYARHIARRSTADDRALLESLAADPSQRPEPLASALKYYVRGDLVMPDGSELTLDELCDRAGVARLPLLEEMPPELDVDFDAK